MFNVVTVVTRKHNTCFITIIQVPPQISNSTVVYHSESGRYYQVPSKVGQQLQDGISELTITMRRSPVHLPSEPCIILRSLQILQCSLRYRLLEHWSRFSPTMPRYGPARRDMCPFS